MKIKNLLIDKYNLLIKEGKLNSDPFQILTLEKLNELSIRITSEKSKNRDRRQRRFCQAGGRCHHRGQQDRRDR